MPCKIGASSYKKRRSNFDRAIKCMFFPMMMTVCVKLELLWGDALDLFEALDKISRVVEAATKGDLRHGRIRRRQHICRLLDSIIGNVVYRCLADERMEKPAKIIFIHSHYFRESRKLYLLGEMRFYILKHGLEQIYLVRCIRDASLTFGIKFLFQNTRKEPSDIAERRQPAKALGVVAVKSRKYLSGYTAYITVI